MTTRSTLVSGKVTRVDDSLGVEKWTLALFACQAILTAPPSGSLIVLLSVVEAPLSMVRVESMETMGALFTIGEGSVGSLSEPPPQADNKNAQISALGKLDLFISFLD
jgi:hypothetical protein